MASVRKQIHVDPNATDAWDALRDFGALHQRRRLAWSIVDGPYTHHTGVAEVLADDDSRTLFQWTTDLLPDELRRARAS